MTFTDGDVRKNNASSRHFLRYRNLRKYSEFYTVCSGYSYEITQSSLQISELIQTLQKRLNLSQEKFAARLKVSFQTVNRWERGHAKPSPMAMTLIELQLRQMGDRGAGLLEAYFSE
ncbi:helix-turn-helix domain-containing protein [Laspinema sp. D1]|uniref:Helix-turn-helix domain-containing protein n=1 Tax=Laspinema palackyanum D2a TaxID=2953684 RepID=A0ABT2MYB3_9CYAN|nr:helix-turn-helix domain-containing protein [Laspinema sp. D2a]